ncbi:TIGR03086 family metal-binding protein [Nocardia sp. NBC_01377]|uniref:TIGR03086 family metal-binding protein n=1 Tax=Nocardia sp. NBC_01377 TaxID=2903595 RepID=UPI00324F6583
MNTSGLRRAFTTTRAVLAVVRDDQFDAPTPCASWNVGALIRHVIDAARAARDAIDGITDRVADTGEDHTIGDYLDAYDDGIRKTLAAFETLRADTSLFGGRLSASALLVMSTQDQFIHGWDLARAVEHSTNLDPELADGLLAHAGPGCSTVTAAPTASASSDRRSGHPPSTPPIDSPRSSDVRCDRAPEAVRSLHPAPCHHDVFGEILDRHHLGMAVVHQLEAALAPVRRVHASRVACVAQ